MSDNKILSDEELAALKEAVKYVVDRRPDWDIIHSASQVKAGHVLALIARLERAESEKSETLLALEMAVRMRDVIDAERDEAHKCLAAAPAPDSELDPNGSEDYWDYHGCVNEMAYYNWYHSPTRQLLLKGQK